MDGNKKGGWRALVAIAMSVVMYILVIQLIKKHCYGAISEYFRDRLFQCYLNFSNNLCSLMPDVDRLVLAHIWCMDGAISAYQFYEATIRSRVNDIQKIFGKSLRMMISISSKF